jgi:hypothetical protein
MHVWVQIGPVFVGSAAEKISGGVFAIGHVVEKEAVAVGQRSCCWWLLELCCFSSGPKRRRQ